MLNYVNNRNLKVMRLKNLITIWVVKCYMINVIRGQCSFLKIESLMHQEKWVINKENNGTCPTQHIETRRVEEIPPQQPLDILLRRKLSHVGSKKPWTPAPPLIAVSWPVWHDNDLGWDSNLCFGLVMSDDRRGDFFFFWTSSWK